MNLYKILITIISVVVLIGCNGNEVENQPNDDNPTIDPVTYNNPIVRNVFTADPAPFVYNDVFYIYTGHDEQVAGAEGFVMNDWLLFSSKDMVTWENHGAVLATETFSWANGQAWAAHVVEKEGKFYYFVTVEHATIPGKAIGVAVGESPEGPFTDAIGEALITNDMTTQTDIAWDDIDPAIFIDDDGEAYMYWGNTVLKYVKLKPNMIEIDGEIQVIDVPQFTEGPWVFKREDKYYLTYSAEFPEVIDYAMADDPTGPWEYKGRLNDLVPNSPTNHQGVENYKGNWYFVYHNGALPSGGEFRRSVCIDYLNFNEDGTLQVVKQTSLGVSAVE